MATYVAESNDDAIVPFYQEFDNYKPIVYGTGSISDEVLELGLPVSRRVMLFERSSGYLVKQTWSGTDGKYSFNGIDPSNTYFVVSLDENNDATQFNSVSQDLLPGNYDEQKAQGLL